MRKQAELTAEELRKIVHYDPETGIMTWKTREHKNFRSISWNARYAGQEAGHPLQEGRIQIKIWGVQHQRARLAWLYMTGAWPEKEIDHEDADASNDKWSNPRPSTRQQNGANRRLFKNNTSGYKGVHWGKASSKWIAMITVSGKRRNLGSYDDPAIAHQAYMRAATAAFGEYARGG